MEDNPTPHSSLSPSHISSLWFLSCFFLRKDGAGKMEPMNQTECNGMASPANAMQILQHLSIDPYKSNTPIPDTFLAISVDHVETCSCRKFIPWLFLVRTTVQLVQELVPFVKPAFLAFSLFSFSRLYSSGSKSLSLPLPA